MPLVISSATCSLVLRSIEVSHRRSTSARIASSRSPFCASASNRAISRSHSRMLWRWTSVGCAVSTGLTCARQNHCIRPSKPTCFTSSSACDRLPGRRGAPAWACAHHVHRLVDVERIQQAIELRLAPVLLAEADRRLTDALDAPERIAARLVADHLAEQPPEEAPVLAQQVFLVVE